MSDFGVNLRRCERKIQRKFQKKINKNLNDLKLILLEQDHFCSSKVWENRFFLYCMTVVDPSLQQTAHKI